MNGKGSKSRITNVKAYNENFDQINWKQTKNFIGGKEISREEAFRGLGNQSEWDAFSDKMREEFKRKEESPWNFHYRGREKYIDETSYAGKKKLDKPSKMS